jgi:UvrD-like helicase C-terminal domain
VRAAKKDIKPHDFLTQPKSSYIIMQHYMLLSRNLLYTGLTRAKQLAILVGPMKAIGLAVKRVMDRQRYTALAERLKSVACTVDMRGDKEDGTP